MKKITMLLAAVCTFLGAFLLFQIQPMIAKKVLPWFGGTPAVWSTCMVFFQTFLLLGYAFAYAAGSRLTLRRQFLTYGALLILAGFSLSIYPSDDWKPDSVNNPIFQILQILFVSVGFPYFVLSALSPLFQIWVSRVLGIANPYLLYALSNFGSLLALLTYPTLVDPNLNLRHQTQIWSLLFLLFIACCLALIYFLWRTPGEEQNQQAETAQVSIPSGTLFLWFGLSFCSSALLLAVTSHISHDIAVIPLLWILPLSIYLLSFILVFANERFYPRKICIVLSLLLLTKIADVGFAGPGSGLMFAISFCLFALFIFCLVCHGELVRLKPPPAALGRFYLLLSAGGAFGGIFVGLIAPVAFRTFAEFPLALLFFIAILAIRLLAEARERNGNTLRRRHVYCAILACAPVVCIVIFDGFSGSKETIDYDRNFFGMLSVRQHDAEDPADSYRQMVHGLITHGSQYLAPDKRRVATTYFTSSTALGKVLRGGAPDVPRKIGVIGLGVGTVATYARPGDVFRFYEIDQHVVKFAEEYFTFLKDSAAKIEIILGDARLRLEREASQDYDVFVLDAFSGDAIPIHLLTKEAFDLYRRHLKPDGVIVAHISNLHINLVPVLMAYAAKENLKFCYSFYQPPAGQSGFAHYGVISQSADRFQDLSCAKLSGESDKSSLWTDEYSSVFHLLR